MSMQIMMRMVMMVVIVLNKVVGFLVLVQLKNCHLVVHCPGIHHKKCLLRACQYLIISSETFLTLGKCGCLTCH